MGILMTIEPSISKKDISKIRLRMERALSDSFSSVELSYYPRDSTTSYLKIMADLALFRLDSSDVVPWYSRLLQGFLRQFNQDLKELNYSIQEIQVTFLTRSSVRGKEEDFIPLPTPQDVAAILSKLVAILSPPPAEPQATSDAFADTPHDPAATPTIPKEAPAPVSWLERELGGPNELEFRKKALLAYRENRIDDGIQCCVKGLELYPNSPYLLYLLGTLILSQERYQDALGIFDYLIAIHTDCPQAYVKRSGIRHQIGDVTGSEEDRKKALELQPDHVVRE